jgi:hypothetical protein
LTFDRCSSRYAFLAAGGRVLIHRPQRGAPAALISRSDRHNGRWRRATKPPSLLSDYADHQQLRAAGGVQQLTAEVRSPLAPRRPCWPTTSTSV